MNDEFAMEFVRDLVRVFVWSSFGVRKELVKERVCDRIPDF